jgi:hypothetical protein
MNRPKFARCPPYTLERLNGKLLVHRNPPFEFLSDWIVGRKDDLEKTAKDSGELDTMQKMEVFKHATVYMYGVPKLVEKMEQSVLKICDDMANQSFASIGVPLSAVKKNVMQLMVREKRLYGMLKNQLHIVFGLDRHVLVTSEVFLRVDNVHRDIAIRVLQEALLMFHEVSTLAEEVSSWAEPVHRSFLEETLSSAVKAVNAVLERWVGVVTAWKDQAENGTPVVPSIVAMLQDITDYDL